MAEFIYCNLDYSGLYREGGLKWEGSYKGGTTVMVFRGIVLEMFTCAVTLLLYSRTFQMPKHIKYFSLGIEQ